MLSGPLGGRRPARPEEEVREDVQPSRIADRHLLHGVVLAQLPQGRIAAEERRRSGSPTRAMAFARSAEIVTVPVAGS